MRTDSPRTLAAAHDWVSALIGGRSVENFNEEVRERRWALHAAAFPQAEIEDIFYSTERLEADIGSSAIEPGTVDVFVDGMLVRLGDLQHKSGHSHLAVVVDQIRKGAMIRVRDLQKASPGIERIGRELERLFLAPCQSNLYLAPSGCAGFPAHFDISDAFIVQCSGAKDWTIYEDYVDRQTLPTRDTPWEPERYRSIGSGHAVTLRAGDVLYLPRGVMHAAQCSDQHSLHLTISLEPLTYADLLVSEVKRLARLMPELRARAVWSWDGGDQQLTATLREQIRALGERVEAGPPLQKARRTLARSSDVDSGTLRCALLRQRPD